MRAMPYTPAEPAGHSCDGDWRYWCLACAGDGEPDLTAQKHLTDAECAAEYWRAKASTLSSHFNDHTLREAFKRGDYQFQSGKELRTWHRFATHPHADEEER